MSTLVYGNHLFKINHKVCIRSKILGFEKETYSEF